MNEPKSGAASCAVLSTAGLDTWLVKLEDGVWLAPWRGDPGRTLIIGNARRFRSQAAAHRALAGSLRFRGFEGAQVVSNVEVRGAPLSARPSDRRKRS